MFMYFLLPKNTINATACSFPISGNVTISSTCDLGALTGTVDGVDAGAGTTNTGAITINNGVTLTVGNGDNQTLTFGTITNNGTIIIVKNKGASLRKGPLWMQDCDSDGIPGSLIQTISSSSPGTGYRRRNLMNTISSYQVMDSASYAWGENIGWIVKTGLTTVPDSGDLSGWLWAENIGWISLNCSNTSSCGTADYKVTNSNGTLSGYAWSENAGWINFSTGANSVTIDGNGDFAGWAWAENIGWMSFNCSNTGSCASNAYKMKKGC